MRNRLSCLFVATWMAVPTVNFLAAAEIDFDREVRPILSDACFHCHGPDESSREADLRLDQETSTDVIGESANDSELLRRLQSTDPDDQMPPPDSGKALNPKQIELIAKWIDAGANWPQHWSFVSPVKTVAPTKFAENEWVRRPFDAFILSRLISEKLAPAEVAERHTLIRRLSFDLTGLPPTWQEVVQFQSDSRPDAYERVVDRLLASDRFGERMAMDWLDVARFSDTDGYQADSTRTNWPWRDWVVRAFNRNMPFDQFTLEQFAGDLIDNPTPDQVIATCFHRNHMTNGEGGRDPEESRVEYVIDRVNTIGTVWLGLTLGCTQCHSHKYDPISHAEYYQLNAFFDSINEDGKAGGGAKPFFEYKSDHSRASLAAGLADSEAWLRSVEEELQEIEHASLGDFPEWIAKQKRRADAETTFASWQRPRVHSITVTHGAELTQDKAGELIASGKNARHEDYQISVIPKLNRISGMRLTILPIAETGRLAASDDGHFILTNMKINIAQVGSSQVREVDVSSAIADYEKEKTGRSYGPVKTVLDDDPRSGWTSMGADPTEQRVAVFGFSEPIVLDDDEFIDLEFRHRSLSGHANLRRFTLEFTDELGPTLTSLGQTPLEQLAASSFDELDESTQGKLREQYLADQPNVQKARYRRSRAKARRDSYRKPDSPIRVMVLAESDEPRTTHILERGVWDKKGAMVQRGVPSVLPPLPSGSGSPSRLELAKWIASPENPLTARVYVNRIWQMLFGLGLVRTPDDFGMQGDPPTHPEVLDWLAVDFVESGWDTKGLIKQIVMSATYRQRSDATPSLLEVDPSNRLLARNGRFRLPSWMIRDAAIFNARLLDARMGGPPVYPPQPPGAWSDATMGRFHYQTSVGSDRYRRSLYTFWRRSVGPTGMFDASKRRNCTVRAVRTNTPLHALTLLNDETYVEAARSLAARVIKQTDDAGDRIDGIMRTVVSRAATPYEKSILLDQLAAVTSEFKSNRSAAKEFLKIGQANVPNDIAPVELASYATIASTILNLDEAITRE